MTIALSPNMKLLYGLDESQALATRINAAAANVTGDYHLTPGNASGTEGLPVVTDDRGGKAVNCDQSPGAPWTSTRRWLYDTAVVGGSAMTHKANGVAQDPGDWTTAGEGWVVGCRFNWLTLETGGGLGSDTHHLFGLTRDTGAICGIQLRPDTNTSPATGGELYIRVGRDNYIVNAASSTWGNDPGNDVYIDDSGWFRVIARIYYNGADIEVSVWIIRESDGVIFDAVKTSNISVASADWQTPETDGTSEYRWAVGCWYSETDHTSHPGHIDECWYYGMGDLTDEEIETIIVDGINIPWTEPDYHREDHIIRSAVTKEDASYPKTRVLPTGATVCRHPVDVLCQEIRCRLENWHAGQPWALRALDYTFDPAGPYGSQRARRGERPDLSVGVWRTPGAKPYGACEDSRNVEFTRHGPRRRRGFKIRLDPDPGVTATGFNAFFSFRDYADELHRCFKVGTELYRDTGTAAADLDTGWGANESPVGFTLDGRLVLLSPSRQRIWNGDTTIGSLGVAAPGSLAVAAGAGGTLNGDYYYAATFYDPSSGDESGPVVSAQVSPSTQKVTLTLPASAPETRYTQYRIYRTTNGGTAPNFLLVATITLASSYDDTGLADGTQTIPQVTASDGTFLAYITGALPDTFAIGISHRERAIYAKGATNPERIYIAEPNEPQRFYAAQWIAADGPVRALASWQGRVLVFTDNTVEIVESDFVRDANGALNITRTVITRSVGALGHNSVITFQGRVFWLDRRGFFTMQGTEAVPISDRVDDLVPYLNMNMGDRFVGGWNHMTRTLWWTVACTDFQTDSTRLQTQFVMPVDEPGKWYFHGIEAAWVGQFDDDLNGQRFGCMDHLGIFKELESYEGDGQEGDEAGTYEDDGTDDFGSTPAGITSLSGNTIAVEGSPGWTTDEHRGKGVTLRDRSTGLITYHTIRSNTSGGFTVETEPSAALAAGDGYYIGAFPSWIQLAAHDFGSANRKIVRQVQYTFADLTKEDLFL